MGKATRVLQEKGFPCSLLYVRENGSSAANNSSLPFFRLALAARLFLKQARIVKLIMIHMILMEDETYLVSHSENNLSGKRAVKTRSHDVSERVYSVHFLMLFYLS